MIDVGLLAIAPRRLGPDVGVRAAQHGLGHRIAEPPPDLLQHGHPALVFDRVVQQGGNRFVLVAAIFQDDARHAQQMRHVGHAGNLALLFLVQFSGVGQGGRESEAREA